MERERNYTITLGIYPGVLLGFRAYEEKDYITYVLYLPFVDIALEIDGEQHYVDERIVKSNFYRDEYLKSIGVETIRVRWSHYQKLSNEEKKDYLINLYSLLTCPT